MLFYVRMYIEQSILAEVRNLRQWIWGYSANPPIFSPSKLSFYVVWPIAHLW